MTLSVHSDTLGSAQGTLIQNLRLDVQPGQILTLMGASGSGKSSVLAAIAGTLDSVAEGAQALRCTGTVRLDGEDITHRATAQRGIGLLFGAMAGSAAAQDSYAITQQRFDSAYYGCMYARGHKVPVPANDVARYRTRYDRMTPRTGPAPVLNPGAAVPPPPDFAPPESRPPTR
jgi:ABC-type dipeptide/oligopeptide/nickel transport system ATPase component